MRARRPSGRAVLLTAAILLLLPAQAHGARDFQLRFGVNLAAGATSAANTMLSCPDIAPTCSAGRAGTGGSAASDNNDFAMSYVDVDADPTTFDSSSASLVLPSGADPLFAGLYWGADRSAGSPGGSAAIAPQALGAMRLRGPGDAGYRAITADALDTIGTRYQGFADVTRIVRDAGAGLYTAANVQAGTGPNRYAGWALMVVYADASQPVRGLSLFDGFTSVSMSEPNVNVPISGFKTPARGPVRTTLGFLAYEGDRSSAGDSLRLNTTTASSPARPADNFFNSTIDRAVGGAAVPNDDDNFGFDAGLTASADGVLSPGDTSAVIRLATKPYVGGESYLPGAVLFATSVFAPRIQPVMSVTDLDGDAVEPGDVLEYTVRLHNDGEDSAGQVVLRAAIPDRTTFVPASLGVGSAASDAAGDDTAEFDADTNSVVFRLGGGADARSGGALDPGASATVRFRVRVDAPVPSGTTIAGTARADFSSPATGPLHAASAPLQTAVQTPDLTIDKSHTGVFRAGGSASFHLAVRNAGGAPTTGPVVVTDAFDAAEVAVTGASGAGWTCSAGPAVTCTRTDPLPTGATYPPIDVAVAVAADAPPDLANTASVTGGGDGDPTNNTDTDTAGVVAEANLAVRTTVAPVRIPIGETATYRIAVVNNGPATATGVTLADPLPAGVDLVSVTTDRGTCDDRVTCAIGRLPVGATALVLATVRGTGGGTTTNTATVSGDQTDPVPADDEASAPLDVVAAADLSIDAAATPAPVDVGAGPAALTYTLTVHNAGPQAATRITVDDQLPPELTVVAATTPAGTCSIDGGAVHCAIPGLAPGADATITVATTVPDTVPGAAATSMAGRTLVNGAVVSGAPDDPDLLNDTATTSTLVLPSADVEVTLSGTGEPVSPGETTTVTMDVVNRGPSTAGRVTATVRLPEGTEIVSVPAGCSVDGRVVGCPLGALVPGGSRRTTILLAVSRAATPGSEITIDGEAADAVVPDAVQASNRDTLGVTVVRAASPESRESGAPRAVRGPAECLSGIVRLVDLTTGRTRVRLAGETSPDAAGRSVSLHLAGRTVGSAEVRADGAFSADVPLPPRSVRSTNAARYRAVLGTARSKALKLSRRMTASKITSKGGRVTISGRVTGPLARPARTVTVRRYTDCRARDVAAVSRGIRVRRDGSFHATVPAPRGGGVAYYRAETRVRTTTRSRRTYRTYTLVRGVVTLP